MSKKRFSLIIILLLCGNVFAATWFGGYIDDQFTNAGNWNSGDPLGQDCVLSQGLVVELTAPPSYNILSLKLGAGLGNMNTLNMNGGTLDITNGLEVGNVGTAGEGTLNINSGQITCAYLHQGYSSYGEINMTDPNGLLYVSSYYYIGVGGGYGVVNLDGGVFESEYMVMTIGSQITITGGTLKMNGNWGDPTIDIPQYIADGWITAAPDWDLQTEIINGGLGIQVSATPEPCPVPPQSDANGDCHVDMADLAIMASEWLTCNLTEQSDCWQ